MHRLRQPQGWLIASVFTILWLVSCSSQPIGTSAAPVATGHSQQTPPIHGTVSDKWALWTSGTQLRGANIYQRRVYPELDGNEFMGPGPFGPPYTQSDFDRLSSLGANFVDISHPGLFTEMPPYIVDEAAVANLDHLLEMIAQADMFAVITFRTGPGRSEFSLLRDGAGEWFDESYLNETVWEDPVYQAAWVDMWRYTAERYRTNPIVVGFDLMCEPNSNDILDDWDPSSFHSEYGGSSYDWNTIYPPIVQAIREVDPSTPILIGGNGYSAAAWLAYIQPTGDSRTVHIFHQYAPYAYTHQDPRDGIPYPGEFDLDYDGEDETFDRPWLEEFLVPTLLIPPSISNSPVAVNEFGAVRWTPDGATFLRDEMEIFERNGWNYAIWQWYPDWPPLAAGDTSFNYRLGPDPWNFSETDNEILSVLVEYWSKNTIRPQNYGSPAAPLSLPTGPGQAGIICPGEQPPFVTDFEIQVEPHLEEPERGIPYRDPAFGSCIVRVTDRHADLSTGDPSAGLKNEYSRVQSFNSDDSLLLVRGIEATWYVYDTSSLLPLGQVPLDIEPRWSVSDPYVVYYSSDTRLMAYDLRTGEASLVRDFATDAPGSRMVWTRYEGSPSADGRYWGLMGQDETWRAAWYLVFDLQANAVVAARDLRGWSEGWREVDSVTISPLGSYFLAYMDRYCEHGQLGTDSDPCGLMIYQRDLQEGRGLLRIAGHSDLALDTEGREVLVYQDIDNDTISVIDLETGQNVPLWPIDFTHCDGCGIHFSGRAFDHPGWVLVSYFDGDPDSYWWMDDQILAIELQPGGRVVRLAHHHSLVDGGQDDYWAEPHASVNRDFTRVIFSTNWGRSGTGEVELFLLQLQHHWDTLVP
ncbi:MAG: cellulase family glycosylhydrolase [Chloroflexota bacterium]